MTAKKLYPVQIICAWCDAGMGISMWPRKMDKPVWDGMCEKCKIEFAEKFRRRGRE